MWGPKNGWNGYITPAFLGSPHKGTKSEVAPSPMPSWGAICGRNGDKPLVFLGVPNIGTKMAYVGPVKNCPQGRYLKKKWLLKDPLVSRAH